MTVICFMGLLLCFRSQYGVDFTDESHYLALAKRFSQGDRPFREEWFPAQVIGILLLPFFNIYSRITGGTDGIILAARIVFVIFHVMESLMVFWILIKEEKIERVPSFIFAVLFLFYARANIHNFSYYNLGLMTFLFYLITRKNRNVLCQMGRGILFSITVLCMPYMIIYFVLLESRHIVQIITGKRKYKRELLYLSGIAFSTLIFLAFCFTSGNISDIFRNIPEILKDPEHQETIMGSLVSFGNFMICIFYKYLFWPMLAEFFGIAFYIWNGRKIEVIKIFLKVVAYMLFYIQSAYLRTFFEGGIIIALFLLAVQISALDQIYERDLWKHYAFPGLAFGCIWMLGSNVGQRVFNMGCLISCIWAVTVIWKDAYRSLKNWTGILKICTLILTLMTLACISFFDIYRDDDIKNLTVKLNSGVAKGLYTSERRAEEYEKVLSKLNEYADEEKVLVVEGVNPWIYLEAEAYCGAYAVWHVDFTDERNKKYYGWYPEKIPGVIFLINPSYGTYHGWRYSSHGSNTEGNETEILEGYLKEMVEIEHYIKIEEECGIFYIKR